MASVLTLRKVQNEIASSHSSNNSQSPEQKTVKTFGGVTGGNKGQNSGKSSGASKTHREPNHDHAKKIKHVNNPYGRM